MTGEIKVLHASEDEDFDDAKSIDETSPEEREMVFGAIREAIRRGNFTLTDVARKQMEERGLTEDDLMNMLLDKAGRDS